MKMKKARIIAFMTVALMIFAAVPYISPLSVFAADTSAAESAQNDWFTKDGKRYYRKNGKVLKNCWLNRKGKHIAFLTKTGEAAVGKHTIDGTEYEFNENGILLTDDRMSIEITDYSLDNFTVCFTINEKYEGKRFEYGDDFDLERLTDGEWVRVPYSPKEHDIVSLDMAYGCTSGKIVYENKLEWLYGENLIPGRYRYCRDMWIYADGAQMSPEDYDRCKSTYYAYFDIEDEE